MPYFQAGKENSGNINLYYEDHGMGKPVVLIHGFPLSTTAWEKQVPVLLKAGYRVITYDRRGFGKSSQPTSGYDYDTFAGDLDQLITKLDLRDVTLVGHSMGTGEVARYLGKFGSSRVVKAVFLSPILPFLLKTEGNPEGVDGAVFEKIKESIVEDRLAYLTHFFSDFYNAGVLKPKGVSKELLQFNWNVAAEASPIGTYECVNSWLTDFRKDLSKIDVPSLIIHGTADHVLPFSATALRAQVAIKGSKLVPIEGAPHAIPITHADIVNSELLEFLKLEVKKLRVA